MAEAADGIAAVPDCDPASAEACAAPAGAGPVDGASTAAFDFGDVREKARLLAQQAFVVPPQVQKGAAELNYDQYRRIQNTQTSMIWPAPEDAFRILPDPRGYLFTLAIAVNLIEDGVVKARPYAPADFDFEDLPLAGDVKSTLGFAGFRVLTELNEAGKFDELVSFKGASFFRALGQGTVYGASARGLAIGTASPDGEEFPHFSEFWLVKPEEGSDAITIYALMDGISVTGAFAFRISGGTETRTDVTATFFPRRPLSSVGVAPLTSMYFFSPHDLRKQADDFRPAVHDSEGLMIDMANGEWVWRPLVNPQALQISVLATQAPRGFGLVQRKRGLDGYSDVEADYHRRPNVWIEPSSDWGAGQLSLVEIPTANEYNDNVVVFWRPTETWQPGRSYDVSYSMRWSLTPPAGMTVVPVAETRSGKTPDKRRQLFVIDFLSADEALMGGAEASISTSAGTIHNPIIKRNQETGKTRLTFELDAENASVAELRALLTQGGTPVSETWLYRWRAE
ncbi:glucan biosynthesis protein G [Hyphomonas sp.]|uniref:glucan biosynthesis protein G n=1 Tax=Hyphomonas sp. TaxID=87 RepID=UPI00391DB655